ncbi:MFS transporter [Amycolatopsis rhabdoformis]|uniref:MFS transporter n=1 Tax=Amycolatopsis rhabdoformis TaxID=1448059 RepID=A0ABZ1IH35_9PSEU|nr:MFS transporter [Amycolatopsis rhabdoformis]WSE33702.1 MFS transporter [Amycolatopsis rhabdoformis]
MAQLMLLLDATVVNVALAPIQQDLPFTHVGLSWVVNGYTLPFGGLLLLGGRIADGIGRRRVFVIGLALFAVASAIGGVAGTPALLILSRVLQGVGGALVAPAALSLVTVLFTEPGERARALSTWGVLRGLGAMLGAVLGGVLVTYLSWRWVFFINLPIAALALAFAPRLVPESRGPRTGRLDIAGAVLVTLGLTLLVYGLLASSEQSWGSPLVVGTLAAGVVLLAAFFWWQRKAANPLVPLGFLRSRRRAVGNFVLLAFSAALAVLFFTLALYLQQVVHLNALYAGLSFLPIGPLFMLTGWLTARLIPRIGQRAVMVLGSLLLTAAFVLFADVHVGGSYVRDVFIGVLLFALGAGFTVISGMIASVDGATGADAGLASGINNTAQQIGLALGLATLVAIGDARTRALTDAGTESLHAAAAGYSLSFAVTAGLMAVAALVAAFGLPSARSAARNH